MCISVQRIYVNSKIRNEFVERFVEGARKLHIGHPHEAATDISSLITEGEAQRVEGWIQEAVEAGAKLASGGGRKRSTIEPTVLTDVPAGAKVACREAFGPVVGINSYESLDEAIAMVNDSEYGLQAGIYTRDIQKAFDAAQRVHVGGFMINEIPQYRVDQMPYGGVKLSGSRARGPEVRHRGDDRAEADLLESLSGCRIRISDAGGLAPGASCQRPTSEIHVHSITSPLRSHVYGTDRGRGGKRSIGPKTRGSRTNSRGSAGGSVRLRGAGPLVRPKCARAGHEPVALARRTPATPTRKPSCGFTRTSIRSGSIAASTPGCTGS